jgi:hypothetical protein
MKNIGRIYLLLLLLIVLGSTKSQYRVVNTQSNASSMNLTLLYTGSDDYYIKPTSPIVKYLKFMFSVHTFSDFYVRITDLN